VIPEFVALREGGGDRPGAGSQHVHLHGLPVDRLKEIASGKRPIGNQSK
jgi:hypothetical protein